MVTRGQGLWFSQAKLEYCAIPCGTPAARPSTLRWVSCEISNNIELALAVTNLIFWFYCLPQGYPSKVITIVSLESAVSWTHTIWDTIPLIDIKKTNRLSHALASLYEEQNNGSAPNNYAHGLCMYKACSLLYLLLLYLFACRALSAFVLSSTMCFHSLSLMNFLMD